MAKNVVNLTFILAVALTLGCKTKKTERANAPSTPPPVAVVLVASDDALKVRSEAGVGASVVGQLVPGQRDVTLTGERAAVDGAVWMRVQAGSIGGWVNARYLHPAVDAVARASELDIRRSAQQLIDGLIEHTDLRAITSSRGFDLVSDSRRMRVDQSAFERPHELRVTALVEAPECPDGDRFGEALADGLVDAWYDERYRLSAVVHPDLRYRNFPCIALHPTAETIAASGAGGGAAVWRLCYSTGEPGSATSGESPQLALLERASVAAVDSSWASLPTLSRVSQAPAPKLTSGPVSPLRRVVMVAGDDKLNVRKGPAADAVLLTALAPGAKGVKATGQTRAVGGSTWAEIEVTGGPGWVNARYLTEAVEAGAFAKDAQVMTLLEALVETARVRGDLSALVGPRGLWVFRDGGKKHFAAAELSGLLSQNRAIKFGNADCDECRVASFFELVGRPLVDVYFDVDRELGRDRWIAGGNGELHPPAELAGFHHVGIFDGGDQPCLGLDWQTMTVFFEYVAGQPAVVAIVRNQWSP